LQFQGKIKKIARNRILLFLEKIVILEFENVISDQKYLLFLKLDKGKAFFTRRKTFSNY